MTRKPYSACVRVLWQEAQSWGRAGVQHFGKTCGKCGGKNHWAAVCKGGGTRRVRLLDADPEQGTEEFLVIDSVLIGNLDDDVTRPVGRWQEQLTVDQSVVNIKLDTGAQANVISLATLTIAMPEHSITPTNVILTGFGDGKIQPLGTTVIPCKHKGQDWRIKFYVSE